MASRPRLKPYFQPLRRGPGTVQLGLSAGSGGVVLTGLSSPEIALLIRLDGTLTETELCDDAAGRGIAPERAAGLFALLREHHLLDGDLDGAGPDRVDLGRLPGAALASARLGGDDAPILALPGPPVTVSGTGVLGAWTAPRDPARLPHATVLGARRATSEAEGTGGTHVAGVVDEENEFREGAGRGGIALPPNGTRQLLHRTGRRVVVSGRGRLPWAIGSLLRTTGVGQVAHGPAAIDALDQALRADPGIAAPDLVILVGSGVLDPHTGDPWWRRGVPTLPVVTDGRRIVVGPVLDDPSGPCLHCLDLERADRDAAWPALVAQLSTRTSSRGSGAEVSSESTLTAMASGVIAMIVTAHLAGGQGPTGISVEMSLPWPRLDHRQWARHPHCAAHARAPHPGDSGFTVEPASSAGAG